ncbi:hypothetical protein AA313_de0202005 [Arthrobotrys entomopaga]|nr:hypothetical protein AA313_de0202005 [Arthrobotrys entomopaga]
MPGFYSTIAEISTFSPNINLLRAKDPCLEVDEFIVLGGDDHMYGALEPVGRIPIIKACIDTLPVSSVSLPSVEQWSRLFVQAVAEIWYVEIAWLKFSQTLPTERIGKAADLKRVFVQKFQPGRKAILNASRKATKHFFEPMYQEAGITARLVEIRRTFKDIRKVFEAKAPDTPQQASFIPGTRRPLLRQRNIPLRHASSTQPESFATQPFATQFFPDDLKYIKSETNTGGGSDLEPEIRKFKLEPLDEEAITAFSEIIRSLYEEARDGYLYEKDVTAIRDHILDFYATRMLSTLRIERATDKVSRHPHAKRIIQPMDLLTKKPSRAQLESPQDSTPAPLKEPSPQEPTMTPSRARPMISRENLVARLARLSNSNLKSGTSKKSSRRMSEVAPVAQDITPTPKESRRTISTNSSREFSLPPPPPSAPSYTKTTNREQPSKIKTEVVEPPKRKSPPPVKTKKKKQERPPSPIALEKVPERPRPIQNHAVPREKQKTQPPVQTPRTPPPQVKVKKPASPRIKMEEVEMDLVQDLPMVQPEPEPLQVEAAAPEPSLNAEPGTADVAIENIDATTQFIESEDLLTRINKMLNLIRQEQEYDKMLPDRAVVPQEQAEMLSKISALWPPPKMELQKHLHKQPKLGMKGMPPRTLEYPRDFEPYHSTIETWSTESTQNNAQQHQPANKSTRRPENGNSTTTINQPEQHVFTLTNQPAPEEEEEAEIEWEATPKSQLKDPKKFTRMQEENEGEQSEDDSDAESYLNDQPPPASSAEQYAVPAKLIEAQREHQREIAQVANPSSVALAKSSPPRAQIPGYRMLSSPPPTSTPNTPRNSRMVRVAGCPGTVATRSPVSSAARVPVVPTDPPSDNMGNEEEAQNQQEEEGYDDDSESEEEEPEARKEIEVQVPQTQTTTSGTMNSTEFETATENQSGQIHEGEKEAEERSPQRIISSSQLERPVTPPTISPGASKRKADELESSPVKAGSLASPRIFRNTKVVKVDEGLMMRNFKFLGKHLDAVVASSKAGVRKALRISEDDLDSSNAESSKEKRKREWEAEMEAHFRDD